MNKKYIKRLIKKEKEYSFMIMLFSIDHILFDI